MSGTTDQAKGHVKEAVGDITGNDKMKHEGKADRLAGEVKEKAGDVKDKVDGAVDKVKEVLHKD